MHPSSAPEMAYFTQSMTTPSSCPGLSPTAHQSPLIDYNCYALASPEDWQAIYSPAAIQQQSMSQGIWQASQQAQANAEYYSSQVAAEQFHTVDQHDLALKGYGEAFNQEYVCDAKHEDEGLNGYNMDATVAEYPLISQIAKYDFTEMRNALISPACPYTSESVALFNFHLDDGTQYLDQCAAPTGN